MPERFIEQVVLALEVEIDDALRQAGFPGDVAQGGAAHPLARNALHRCIDQLQAPGRTGCGPGVIVLCGCGHVVTFLAAGSGLKCCRTSKDDAIC
jgi:hypothetical protein